jgi:hypothetical protein
MALMYKTHCDSCKKFEESVILQKPPWKICSVCEPEKFAAAMRKSTTCTCGDDKAQHPSGHYSYCPRFKTMVELKTAKCTCPDKDTRTHHVIYCPLRGTIKRDNEPLPKIIHVAGMEIDEDA